VRLRIGSLAHLRSVAFQSTVIVGVLLASLGPPAMAATRGPLPSMGIARAPAAETEPVEASLTVHLDAPVGLGGPDTPIYLRIAALGPPFPGSVTLRDEAGVNVATARALRPGRRCPLPARVAVRDIPPGTSGSLRDWCVQVSGLEVGSEVTGTLKGQVTVLELTLGVRHNFFWLPFLVTLFGGAVAVGAAFMARWLRRYLRDTYIDLLVQRNRRSRDRRIAGLPAWVARMRSRRMPEDELGSLVERLVDSGPERIQDARSSLDEALRRTRVPTGSRLYRLARKEADRRDYTIDDFVKAGGRERDTLIPELWVSRLDEATRLAEEILEAEEQTNRLPSAVRNELLRALRVMREDWLRAKDDEDLKQVDDAVNGFQPRLRQALEHEIVAEGGTAPEPLLAPASPEPRPSPPPPPSPRRRSVVAVAVGGVILLAAIATLSILLIQPREQVASPVRPEAAEPPPPATVGETQDGAQGAPPAPEAPPQQTPPEVTGPPSPAEELPEASGVDFPVLPILLGLLGLIALFLLIRLAWGRVGLAISITIGLIILAAAVFIVGVAVSTYAPNPTFGRPADYFTLGTAATSSGALGGILGVLAYWKATGQGSR
jgi:hypothetical protein